MRMIRKRFRFFVAVFVVVVVVNSLFDFGYVELLIGRELLVDSLLRCVLNVNVF